MITTRPWIEALHGRRRSAKMPGKEADGVPREAPKCVNGGCTKQGLHRCGGCRGVMYCSAACQKVHWKQGGHKQECKKPGSTGQTSRGGYGRSERCCGRWWIMRGLVHHLPRR
jgi:hypothetical protein